jgi:uncharacterized membrane protein
MADEVKKTPETTAGTGLEPNVAALLAYLFLGVGGLVIYMIEKENKFVRFAAMQSIVLAVALVAFQIISAVLLMPLLFSGLGVVLSLISWVVYVGFIVVWVMLMVKAYQNQEWELPGIGKIARNAVK